MRSNFFLQFSLFGATISQGRLSFKGDHVLRGCGIIGAPKCGTCNHGATKKSKTLWVPGTQDDKDPICQFQMSIEDFLSFFDILDILHMQKRGHLIQTFGPSL